MDEPSAIDEAQRLGVFARLQSKPCTLDELSCTLGISERVVSSLLGRLAASGVVEEVPGSGVSASHPPAYRVAASRRRRPGGTNGMQPMVGRPGVGMHQGASQGGPPHGFMPAGGMVLPYHPAYSPYPQQVLYYPAGMTPYQQPLAGAQQWHPQRAPGMPGGGPQRGAGGPGAPAAMHAMQPMQAGGGYGMHLQAAYYYTNGGGMAPLTPAVSASQRQLPRAGSSSSASASSTGWGGVPLSQSAAEVLAAGAGPSPRSSPRHQQQSGGVGGPAAADAGAATAAAASTAAAAAAAASETAMRPQHQQHGGQPASAAAAPLPPAAAAPSAAHAPAAAAAGAAEPGLPSPAGPSSGSESCDEAGEASGGGPSSGGSSGDSRGSSSGGSSGGSRRSRGSRERQPCAFFLKTGTCAYGDSCKFAHPFDKAPKVEFNSMGLPLRPGEPECAFYVKNYRCAFGHTCKFHHPELPPPPPPAGVPMQYAMHAVHGQYGMAYAPQPGTSPVLNAVLGLGGGHPHKGPASPGGPLGSPVQAVGSPPFYMTAPSFPGAMHPGFPGRPGMHPGGMHPGGMPPHMVGMMMVQRGPQQRSNGGGGGGRAAAPAAAAAATLPAPLPLPLPVSVQSHGGKAGAGSSAGDHAAEGKPDDSPRAEATSNGTAAAAPAAAAPAMSAPAPLMVFAGERSSGQEQLVSALGKLSLPADATPEGSGAGGGEAGLAHQQPRAELAAAYDQRARTTYIGRSFKATPRQLGFITLACALVQAVCAPIGGLLGHYLNRANVMAWGCFIWGVMAICFSFTNSVRTGMAFWAFNGVGLGLLLPNAQSLIADYFSALSRGKAFGALYLTSALGGMLGALFATNMGHTKPWGYDGWRVAFVTVGIVSLIIGLLNWLFAVDPRFKLEDPQYRQEPDVLAVVSARAMVADIASVLAVPSFVVVVTQGVVGSTPWNALVFITLYLQLLGFSDFHSSLVAALFLFGTAFGAQLGGFIGDWAAKRYPNHGRVAVAQFSVGLGVPLSVLMFKALPYGSSGSVVAIYGTCFTVWGLLISWAGSACNSPIFAEIVPSQLRSIVYSFDRAFEGAVAACGAPIVGWLAERLGFDSDAGGSDTPGGEADMKRAKALGDAIVICTALPWALCCLLYTGLHVTYPRDRRLALRSQRTRSGYAPSLASIMPVTTVPSGELWEATPGATPGATPTIGTPTASGITIGGHRVTFAEGRPGAV
ncbi:MFS general substrate transporter [Micractinium conductrix]|uniref:MFS general substrate transporter n=1 Tax=Micractinium conductrix TaxID=554055 RepID=A0A2P6VR41_9CHLO|nr:MFS general substrate transporter [Micractinium conductrix]|eukprot:PSC76554.1 MFS general substrate transporter [Micractinium conductrix]